MRRQVHGSLNSKHSPDGEEPPPRRGGIAGRGVPAVFFLGFLLGVSPRVRRWTASGFRGLARFCFAGRRGIGGSGEKTDA